MTTFWISGKSYHISLKSFLTVPLTISHYLFLYCTSSFIILVAIPWTRSQNMVHKIGCNNLAVIWPVSEQKNDNFTRSWQSHFFKLIFPNPFHCFFPLVPLYTSLSQTVKNNCLCKHFKIWVLTFSQCNHKHLHYFQDL